MIRQKSNRLEAFSDGVLAIAITLLAFELKVPVLHSFSAISELKELLPLLPSVLTFILSFITIAIFWVNHHQMTDHIESLNRRIIWMNILFLMFQSLIPFATRAIAENPHHALSVATYSFVLFCGSFAFSLTHLFIHKRINKNLRLDSKLIERSVVGPFVYLSATVCSFFFIPIAYFLLIIPPFFYFLPKSSQD